MGTAISGAPRSTLGGRGDDAPSAKTSARVGREHVARWSGRASDARPRGEAPAWTSAESAVGSAEAGAWGRTMSTLRVALAWAERGRAVLPLDGKVPLTPHGVADASTGHRQIVQWWQCWPSANLGLTLGGWCVIDVDQRHGGISRWVELCQEHGEPQTATQLTASGGLHYVFSQPETALRGKLCEGVDVLVGPRRYVVANPSVVAGGRYRWIGRMAPVAMPGWLVELCRRDAGRPVPPSPLPGRDRSVAFSRAVRYAERLDPAISGQGGHATAFRAALLLASRFPELGTDDLIAALAAWNRRCEPPWSERELSHKVESALRSARGERAA